MTFEVQVRLPPSRVRFGEPRRSLRRSREAGHYVRQVTSETFAPIVALARPLDQEVDEVTLEIGIVVTAFALEHAREPERPIRLRRPRIGARIPPSGSSAQRLLPRVAVRARSAIVAPMAVDGTPGGLAPGNRAGRAAHLTLDETVDLAGVAEADPAKLRLRAA